MADPVPDLDLDHLLNECEEEFIQILKENLKLPCESRGYLPTSSSLNPEEQCDDREEVKFRVRQLINLGSSAADIIDFAFSVKQQDRNIYMADKTIDVFNPSSEHEASTSIEKESVMGFEDQPEMTIEGEVFGKPEQMGGSMAAAIGEEAVVGVEDEAYEIKSWLMAERKKLDAVSIVGMPGLGKTTLARKLYYDDSVVSYFNIRAWVYVSQIYEKNNLLLGILSSPYIQLTSDLTDKDLSEELYQCLKGKRYLIVLDDIWDIRVWNDLKGSFPDDNKGSRILFTTRTKDGAFHAQLNSRPHLLRFLNENESWDLLKEKVFHKESCSTMLMEVGKQIARKCAGLPLAIVVVAGLLAKKEKTKEWWERVAESVSSHMVNDRKQYMDTLALSYHHLPDHLQPCFLYFGAFPEDYEIPVWKLIWLWVAEGFIKKHGEESLEDVAADCLNDLIERSLIIVANKRSDGGVKSCRIHDMLHDLCLRKAEEEGFLQRIRGYEQVSSSSSWRRLCIHSHLLDYISSMPSAPDVHSLLCFDSRWNLLPWEQSSFIYPAFGHLRVLDLWYIRIQIFPIEMKELVHLRYVALRCDITEIPPSVLPNLCDLETFIVKGRLGEIILPGDIWTLTKLRHLHINESAILPPSYSTSGFSFLLNNLQTLSTLSFRTWTWNTLEDTPNLRKLGCILFPYHGMEFMFPKLDFLVKLETLKMLYHGHAWSTHLSELPSNLKKITLSKFRLPWSEMSKLGRLPNLEVLKLLYNAFDGPQWETSDDEFPKLKFLKFDSLNISQWDVSSDHFPSLERLVLNRCKQLEEIPSSFADISTLQIIELNWSSKSAQESARQIEDELKNMGNEGLLRILIHPPDNS